jgi:hypothetical protein
MPISDQVLADLREIVSATTNDGDELASMNDAEQLVYRVLPSLLDELESLRDSHRTSGEEKALDALHRWLHSPGGDGALIDDAETFHVERESLECHRLANEEQAEYASLAPERARLATAQAEHGVRIELGPTLLPRVASLVATGRLGRELPTVVQTLFVLGMLDAEGQDPREHVGAPQSHVSTEALFVRFALPHDGAAERAAVLRQLFFYMGEWLDASDPLRPSFAAALDSLPR